MLFRALGLGAAMLSNGKPPPKPLNPGPIFGALLLVVIAVVAVAGYVRHLTVGLLIVAPIICAVIILVGAIAHNMPAKTGSGGSADSIARMRQVWRLLSADCPVCRARPGVTCTVIGEEPLALLDAQWKTMCHFRRMEKAVRYRMVNRDDIIAQWDGRVPEGLHL